MRNRSQFLVVLMLLMGVAGGVQAGLMFDSGFHANHPKGSAGAFAWRSNPSHQVSGDDFHSFIPGDVETQITGSHSRSYHAHHMHSIGAGLSGQFREVHPFKLAGHDSFEEISNVIAISTPGVLGKVPVDSSVLVPEPGSFGLITLGLLGLAWARRDRTVINKQQRL